MKNGFMVEKANVDLAAWDRIRNLASGSATREERSG